jgi:hypothetical protein
MGCRAPPAAALGFSSIAGMPEFMYVHLYLSPVPSYFNYSLFILYLTYCYTRFIPPISPQLRMPPFR